MSRVVIPFASGFRQDIDPKVLPHGALRKVRNLRIRRGGQLAPRFGFDALGLTSHLNDIIASDIFAHNSRLFALASTESEQAPTDLVEYIGQPTQDWRHSRAESLNSADNGKRLNSVEAVRNLGRPQTQTATNAVEVVDVAAAAGRLLVTSNSFGKVHAEIVDAATDALLVSDEFSGTEGRAVAVGTKLFVVHRSGNLSSPGDILRLKVFDAAAGNVFTTLSDISSTPSGLDSFDVCPRATPADGFTVAESRGTTVTVRRFDADGSPDTSFTFTGPAASTVSVLETPDPDERATVAVKDRAGTSIELTTFDAVTGSVDAGPTEVGDAATAPVDQQVGLVLTTGTTIGVFSRRTDGTSPAVHGSFRDVTTHASTGSNHDDRMVVGLELTTRPVAMVGTEGQGLLIGALLPDEGQGTAHNVLHEWYPADIISGVIDRDIGAGGNVQHLTSIARDATTGRYYWGRQVADPDGSTTAVACEFEAAIRQRRQMFSLNNDIYVPSAAMQMFDGRFLYEAGFVNAPVIVSATQTSSAGSLTQLAQYTIVAVYEWFDARGRKHESPPSASVDVLLTGINARIDVVVRGPLSQRRNSTNSEGLHCNVVIYRTLAAPDTTLHRDVIFFASDDDSGKELSFACTQSDDDLASKGIIYTQAATGVRSGPNPFVSPIPAAYGWPSADKAITGGLPDSAQIQESRAAFPNEPITWAANLGGIRGIRADVLAVASLDERRIVFTADEIFQVDGEGLDINGVGDLGAPRKLPAACGLFGGRRGWQSIVESDGGLFYQGTSGLIYMLPRGGGAPVEVGAAVEDTLAEFPNIAAAVYNQGDQTVTFACNNATGDAGTLLVFDISEGQWFQDDSAQPIRSLAVWQQRLVVLGLDGSVSLQRTSHPADTQFTTEVVSGTVHPFQPGVEGQVDLVQFVGEFRADCVVRLYLSRDDGQTEEELTPAELSGRVVGSTFTLSRQPNISNGNRFRLRITCEGQDAPTEGIRYNYAVLHCTSAKTPMLTDDEDHG